MVADEFGDEVADEETKDEDKAVEEEWQNLWKSKLRNLRKSNQSNGNQQHRHTGGGCREDFKYAETR